MVEVRRGRSGGSSVESWDAVTDDDDVEGVTADRFSNGDWQVWVSAAEFARAEPLQSELQDGVTAALAAVPGTGQVWNEDREIWLIPAPSSVDGPALVRAAADVVQHLRPRLVVELDRW